MNVLLLSLLFIGASQARQPPHVIFILVDDLGWNDVGFHGSDIVTPNIDRLARQGVILDNYYVQPMCTPTRGSLLTGKYPIHTGLQHYVIVGAEPYGLPLTEVTLAQRLKSLGYSTHIVGKWHLGFYTKDYLPESRGFDSHLGYYLGLGDYFNHYALEGVYLGYDLHQNGQPFWDQDGVYSTDIFTNRADTLIRSHNKSQPLFLYLAHQAVHAGNEYDPIQAPLTYVDRFSYITDPKRRQFAGMVAALDDSVGVVYSALEESGLLDNTVIIFSTDNGAPTNGMEGMAASNWPLRGSKQTLWQGGVRGAAFVHSPLLQKSGYTNHNLMHVTDWLPTIYNLAGGKVADVGNIDGVDQTDVLFKNATTTRQEVLINIDPIDKTEALIWGDYKIISGNISGGKNDGWYSYSDPEISGNLCPLQENPKTLQCGQGFVSLTRLAQCGQKPVADNCHPEKSVCLFNLKDDPCEYNNLAASLPPMVAKLQERIEAYRRTMIPPGNRPIDPSSDPKFNGGVWQPWQ